MRRIRESSIFGVARQLASDELNSLKSELRSASQVEALHGLLDQYEGDAEFMARLLQCAREPDLESASTWLMLNHLRKDGACSVEQSSELVSLLPVVEGWQARLHVLQSLSQLHVPSSLKDDLYDWLLHLIQDKNNFVRAWTYDGLFRLATQHREYFQEVDGLMRRALKFEKPSVTARIRNLLKELDSKGKTGRRS